MKPTTTSIEKGNGVLFYEIDTANRTYTIDRFPNDDYMVTDTMGKLTDALEGNDNPH